MTTGCAHFDEVRGVEPRTPEGCEECLATGGQWVHLRLCLTCGHVGCCDNSPGRHATKHYHASKHPIIRSFEPDEGWGWCYIDEEFFESMPTFGLKTLHHPNQSIA
ncbi:MAG: ubiquitin carboxyl-terminal hydrolase 14 [Gemmatimonadales bacterium]